MTSVTPRQVDLRPLKRLYTAAGAATATFLPFFVLYLAHRGVTPAAIGGTLAAASLLLVALGPLWGHVADVRLGVPRALAVTLTASALLMAALGLPWPQVLALCLVGAVFGGVSGTSVVLEDSLTLAVLGPQDATAYGSVRQWTSLGWAVVVLVAGAVYQQLSLSWMVPLAVTGLLAMLLTLRGLPTPPPPSGRAGRTGADFAALLRSSPRLVGWLVALAVVAVSVQAATTFVPLAITDAGGGPFLVAVSASVGALIEIPFFGRSQRIVERLGLRNTYLCGVGVQLLVLLSWAVARTPDQIAVTKMLTGVSFALSYAATVVVTSRLVPAHLRASGQGLLQVAAGLGPVLGAAAGGLVYQVFGARVLFLGAAGSLALGATIAGFALSGPRFARRATAAGQDSSDVPVDGSKK